MKKVIEFIFSKISYKVIIAFFMVVLLFLLAPMIYCSFFSYACSDDMWNSRHLYHVIKHGGSFADGIRAVVEGYKLTYVGWAGNWVSIFLWEFCPSIWGDRLYTLVPITSILVIIFSIGYATTYFLKKYVSDAKELSILATILLSILCLQFMPSIKSGVFMFTVLTNYIIPFGILLVSFTWIDKYLETSKVKYLVLISVEYFLLGGVGYPVIMIGAEVLMLVIFLRLVFVRENKRNVTRLFIPFVLFGIGFLINVLSPGNAVRGGKNYTVGIEKILHTILECLVVGTKQIWFDFYNNRPIILVFILIFVFAYELIDLEKGRITYKYPYVVLPILYLVYCGIYAPQIFSRDEIYSSGVSNTIFFVLMLISSIVSIYLAGTIKSYRMSKMSPRLENVSLFRNIVVVTMVLFFFVFSKYLIGTSSDYMIYTYIHEGHLSDYRVQMEKQIENLRDPNVLDVVVPMINEEQGPYMHMPITSDPKNYTNMVAAAWYEKNSVVAK